MTNIYLEKIDANKKTIAIYTINNNSSFEPDYSAPVSPMPLPQNADTQNILIKIEGNSSQISEKWFMKDQTATGSLPSGSSPYTTPYSGYVAITAQDISAKPITAFDQILFFKQFMLPIAITDSYRLTVADSIILGSITPINGVFTGVSFVTSAGVNGQYYYQEYGTITGLKPIMSGDSPVAFDALITFMVGNVVSAYETNVPTAPQNFAFTLGIAGSHTINLSWSAPQDVSGGIVSYKIYRRTWNSSQVLLNTQGSGVLTYVDSVTTSGIVYYYTVVATNSKGLGISSTELVITSP